MRSMSAKAQTAVDVCLLEVDLFDRRLRCLWAPRRQRVSSSIFFMIAGVAEPPKLPLNFTPFQFQGLWLEVTITPPAAPCCFTA